MFPGQHSSGNDTKSLCDKGLTRYDCPSCAGTLSASAGITDYFTRLEISQFVSQSLLTVIYTFTGLIMYTLNR